MIPFPIQQVYEVMVTPQRVSHGLPLFSPVLYAQSLHVSTIKFDCPYEKLKKKVDLFLCRMFVLTSLLDICECYIYQLYSSNFYYIYQLHNSNFDKWKSFGYKAYKNFAFF